MIRSLHTGVSGLKSNQTRMDVTGNNIANINTVAFKRSRASFHEVLGQELRTSGGPELNPSFVGLGVSVAAVQQNWAQGRLEFTNMKHDLALNGDGFFIVDNGGQQLLTRAGDFDFDAPAATW
jgi:flagellar hook protein FlgE